MSHEFEIKQGDTLPALATVLRDGDLEPLDLTNASSVGLSMVLAEHPRTVVLNVAAASFMADATGRVTYAWAAGDTAVVGLYNIEWVVVFPGPTVMTVPSCGFDKVRVNPNLT